MIVALYARVSTTKQAEKDLSIPDQLRQMKEWCKARNYQIGIEYVEAGASATDDRRPVFQQMIGETSISPPPFDAIIIHSLSRFFRDSFQFTFYERQLKKAGVQVISITQQTSDDSAGEMARSIFNLFDEYQSKENGKHTLRAMKENARQGYFNGAVVPYGFRAVEIDVKGNKGNKKRLEIDPSEAAIVKRIFQLYLTGYQGKSLGRKGVAAYLNEHGFTMRCGIWRRTIVNTILTNRLYLGEYVFNRWDNKNQKKKPESEWISISLPPIIEAETFQLAEQRRSERTPDKMPPRIVNSPTLLTGFLRCGTCGSRMTIATGKGGKYRYYKCTSKVNSAGKKECENSNVPMEKLDNLILQTLAERVFTPERVELMMKELQANLKHAHTDQHEQMGKLAKEIDDIKRQADKLYEAVENGFLPLNASLQERVHKHDARRQEILVELASLRRQKEMPLTNLGKKNIAVFCSALKERFFDKASNFGKEYLKLLVDEITVVKREVHLTGSYAALASALCVGTKRGTLETVPSFGLDWLPISDSNQGQGD